MSKPVEFATFEEWADHAGLSDAERAAQIEIGATIGRRFDTADMHRQFAERSSLRALSGGSAVEEPGVPDRDAEGARVYGLLEHLENTVRNLRQADGVWKRAGRRAVKRKIQ